VIVADGCNQTCVINQCLNRGFNATCFFQDCACRLENMPTQEGIQNWTARFQQAAKDAKNTSQRIAYEALGKLKPAIQAFQSKILDLLRVIDNYIKRQALDVFQCDYDCVSACETQENTDIAAGNIQPKKFPGCVKRCSCKNPITVSKGRYNYLSLMNYSGFDTAAWSFFMENREEI